MAIVDVTPSLIGVAREYPDVTPRPARAKECAAHQRAADRPRPSKLYTDLDPALQAWMEVSADVYSARLFRGACLVNRHLESMSEEQGLQGYASLFTSWIVNNYLYDGRLQDTVDCGAQWMDRWQDSAVPGDATLTYLVQSWIADAFIAHGDPECAIQTLERAASMTALDITDRAKDWVRLGEYCESVGDIDRAAWAYERGASVTGSRFTRQYAARSLRRLHATDRHVAWKPETVATALFRALSTGDVRSLWTLASSTHFSLGRVGGEFDFTEPGAILPALIEDLGSAKIRGNPLDLLGVGGKRYLVTEGWTGSTFLGSVMFGIRESPQGWEWCGVSTTTVTPRSEALEQQVFGPPSTYENDPLQVLIKAPWPAPLSMQAGGGLEYWASLPGRILTWLLSDIGLAARSCGYGPGGFYYRQGSHEDNIFAIDFSLFPQHSVLDFGRGNASLGTPIVAVADGHIQEAEARGTTGAQATDNFVAQRIWKSAARVPIADPPGGPILNLPWLRRAQVLMTPYHAKYHHLMGPARVTVLPGMFVEQGFVLGFCDSTGIAELDHLHFEMRDTRLTEAPPDLLGRPNPFYTIDVYGGTVRPTPMDRTSLDDGDSGKCVTSTNEIIVPRPRFGGGLDVFLDEARVPDPTNLNVFCQYLYQRLGDGSIPADEIDYQVYVQLAEICRRTPFDPSVPLPADLPGPGGPGSPPPIVGDPGCLDLCRSGCTDVRSDPRNCGACGRNCGVDDSGLPLACRMGTCVAR